jgi:hypothetical protein
VPKFNIYDETKYNSLISASYSIILDSSYFIIPGKYAIIKIQRLHQGIHPYASPLKNLVKIDFQSHCNHFS